MQALGNPEIGGFYDIVRSNNLAAAEQKGTSIIGIVKKRFDEMYVVKWRLSCLNLSPTQTFSLFFTNTKPAISPDGSFKDVPIGVDPSQWPLDIDVAATQAEANKSALWPGGTFKVFGNFCWGRRQEPSRGVLRSGGNQAGSERANSADPATRAEGDDRAAAAGHARHVDRREPDLGHVQRPGRRHGRRRHGRQRGSRTSSSTTTRQSA